ncbi:MAG: hypothetical protein PHX58_01570 [Desulfovibrio sp.]|nr:hypothetical protein [Desulfovibrio sp.]
MHTNYKHNLAAQASRLRPGRMVRRLIRVVALCTLLLVCGTASALMGDAPGETVLGQGDSWEHPLASGKYAYRIDYLDGDMFVTVNTQFLGPEGGVLLETSHTLVRDQRMSVQKHFRTESVSESKRPESIRFACDSGRVRVALHSEAH